MRTTTDPTHWHFTFGITDLALLLGKSPVTIRSWERKGFVTIPRDSRGDRRLNSQGIREIASTARGDNRINQSRYDLILATMTMHDMIERENAK